MLAKMKPLALAAMAASLCLAGGAASAKVEGDTIVLGTAFYSLDSDEELRRRSVTNVISFLKTGRPENVVVEGTR